MDISVTLQLEHVISVLTLLVQYVGLFHGVHFVPTLLIYTMESVYLIVHLKHMQSVIPHTAVLE
jgi:hypothetical protein